MPHADRVRNRQDIREHIRGVRVPVDAKGSLAVDEDLPPGVHDINHRSLPSRGGGTHHRAGPDCINRSNIGSVDHFIDDRQHVEFKFHEQHHNINTSTPACEYDFDVNNQFDHDGYPDNTSHNVNNHVDDDRSPNDINYYDDDHDDSSAGPTVDHLLLLRCNHHQSG